MRLRLFRYCIGLHSLRSYWDMNTNYSVITHYFCYHFSMGMLFNLDFESNFRWRSSQSTPHPPPLFIMIPIENAALHWTAKASTSSYLGIKKNNTKHVIFNFPRSGYWADSLAEHSMWWQQTDTIFNILIMLLKIPCKILRVSLDFGAHVMRRDDDAVEWVCVCVWLSHNKATNNCEQKVETNGVRLRASRSCVSAQWIRLQYNANKYRATLLFHAKKKRLRLCFSALFFVCASHPFLKSKVKDINHCGINGLSNRKLCSIIARVQKCLLLRYVNGRALCRSSLLSILLASTRTRVSLLNITVQI